MGDCNCDRGYYTNDGHRENCPAGIEAKLDASLDRARKAEAREDFSASVIQNRDRYIKELEAQLAENDEVFIRIGNETDVGHLNAIRVLVHEANEYKAQLEQVRGFARTLGNEHIAIDLIKALEKQR